MNTCIKWKKKYGRFALVEAVISKKENRNDLIKMLVKGPINVNSTITWQSALMYAACDNFITETTFEMIISAGANIDLQNHYGWTALRFSILTCNKAKTKKLLDMGCNLFFQDFFFNNSLIIQTILQRIDYCELTPIVL